MKNPKVSIITVVFNAERTICDCLISVKNQRYKNIEHLIIDGLSSDKTLSIIEDNIYDSIVLKSEADSGIYDALNKGILSATGEIIGILHSDDFYSYPDVIDEVMEFFSDPSVDAVYGNLNYVSKEGDFDVIRHWNAAPTVKTSSMCCTEWASMFGGWMPPHPTLFIRSSCYRKIGGFNTKYKIAADYDFIWRLFAQPKFKAIYLDAVMINMRVGGISNRSIFYIIKKSSEDWQILRSLNLSFVLAVKILIYKNISKFHQFSNPLNLLRRRFLKKSKHIPPSHK
jgi:glycosyltransferase